MLSLTELTQRRIVPVVVVDSVDQAIPLADALVAGNLPVAEVTLRTPVAADVIAKMAARGGILVGAGTVLSAADVDTAVDAGALFIVSPGLSREVIDRARERDVLCLPGAVTASEVMEALRLGITTVKFFPAGTSGGAAAIKALSAPFGNMQFIPTGGIGEAQLGDYLSIPSVVAVGGSFMVASELLAENNYAEITARCARAVAVAARTRA